MGDEKKKRRMRRPELEFFAPTAGGEMVYTGGYHGIEGGEAAFRRGMVLRWVTSLGALAALLAAGFLPVAGMNGAVYVLLPYAAALITAGSAVWCVGRMTRNGYPMRTYVYEATVPRLPARNVAVAVLNILTALGEGAHLLLTGTNERNFAIEFIFLVFLLTSAAFALAHKGLKKGQHWAAQDCR